MRTKYYRDLEAWQCSMALAKNVYRLTAGFPKDEVFGLRSQVRRAAVSVPSNIAEGHGRLSDALFKTFLGQARGSLYEVETQVTLAEDLGYMSREEAQGLLRDCATAGRLINGLLRAIQPPHPDSI